MVIKAAVTESLQTIVSQTVVIIDWPAYTDVNGADKCLHAGPSSPTTFHRFNAFHPKEKVMANGGGRHKPKPKPGKPSGGQK